MSHQPAYRHNGQTVDAARFYAIACDPRRSVAVQACAGAGKTWMLVSRILRALLEGDEGLQPQDILAITFTKKAAGEMRQRLNEWLAAFARQPVAVLEQELRLRGFQGDVQRGKGRLTLSDAATLLQNLYQKVLQAGRPVQIRTFHSWFAALLRTAPLSMLQGLGLPSVYELLEDDAEAMPMVWPRYFERLAATPALRDDFQAAVDAHGRFQTLKALQAALSKRVEFVLADARGVVDSSVQPFGIVFPDLAGLPDIAAALAPGGLYRAQFDAAALALGRASARTFAEKGSELEQALTAAHLDGALAALLTDKGQPRKFSDKVPDIELVRATQELAVRLQAARHQHQAWLHQQRMARLTRPLIEAFSQLKHERGWIDMNDVERAAQAMLADASLSGWLQQRLDARVRHLLIDEFQDTSPLQWQALWAWLSSYAGSGAGEAPRVFIVGDPKQSIYRFRRAEPQVFLAAQAFVREGLGGDLLSCDHTRRNATQVVGVVNAVMEAAQAAGEYADFRAHTTASTQTGEVLSLPAIGVEDGDLDDAETGPPPDQWRDSLTTPRETLEETRRTLECRQAAAWLAAKLGRSLAGNSAEVAGEATGMMPEDIMVLARRRDRLAVMQDELRRLHIPSLQPEKNQLGDAPEVQDIIALLDALISPANDLALAQALKSPLFGCGDDDLVGLALLARQQRGASKARGGWFNLLSIAEHGRHDWKGLAAQLTTWKAWLNQLPPHDALHAIFDAGDVLARFAAAAPVAARSRVVANLRAMLSAALDFDGGRYATPYAFIRALKRGRIKAPATSHPNAVQLLTVHGAKGLEAPLVLMLDTDGSSARAETMGVLVEWPGEDAVPTRFSFLASESRPPVCNAEALAREQVERKREELNALYVAMTRARETLVLSSTTPKRADPSSWWARLQPLSAAVCAPASEPAAAVSGEGGAGSAGTATFELPELPGWGNRPSALHPLGDIAMQNVAVMARAATEPPPPEPPLASDQPDSTESRVGQAMHRLLEWLPTGASPATQPAPWSAGQIATVAQAFGLDAAQTLQAVQAANAIRTGEGAWAWDAEVVAWQANEVPLTHQGILLRLDRLVQRRDTGEWWVLDYKSAYAPLQRPDLREQLATYRLAVQTTTPGLPVRAAFLTAEGRLFELT